MINWWFFFGRYLILGFCSTSVLQSLSSASTFVMMWAMPHRILNQSFLFSSILLLRSLEFYTYRCTMCAVPFALPQCATGSCELRGLSEPAALSCRARVLSQMLFPTMFFCATCSNPWPSILCMSSSCWSRSGSDACGVPIALLLQAAPSLSRDQGQLRLRH